MRQFSLDGIQLEEWAITIDMIVPLLKISDMNIIMDNFITGEWFWDKEIGITNIFKGIKELKYPTYTSGL